MEWRICFFPIHAVVIREKLLVFEMCYLSGNVHVCVLLYQIWRLINENKAKRITHFIGKYTITEQFINKVINQN